MKVSKIETVRKMLERNPKVKAEEIAKKLGIAKTYTYVLMSKARKKENWETISVTTSGQSILAGGPTEAELNGADSVNQPAHYTTGGIETIDFIEAKKLGYNLGNVVKYIARADHKGNKLEDLRKAQWYLTREIANLK